MKDFYFNSIIIRTEVAIDKGRLEVVAVAIFDCCWLKLSRVATEYDVMTVTYQIGQLDLQLSIAAAQLSVDIPHVWIHALIVQISAKLHTIHITCFYKTSKVSYSIFMRK